eukprot:SAG11_NODE_3862_length_2184_cov_3.657554_2_plen_65_part_01
MHLKLSFISGPYPRSVCDHCIASVDVVRTFHQMKHSKRRIRGGGGGGQPTPAKFSCGGRKKNTPP